MLAARQSSTAKDQETDDLDLSDLTMDEGSPDDDLDVSNLTMDDELPDDDLDMSDLKMDDPPAGTE
jgi:hypothetical protein